ncbi:unnamed protein product [Rotaria sordida]|uniref:Uncharacterized protein n=1 Tax=Rotaria sordida TaxID=392033 RepID=A0A814YC60_9BILA|nr:unnamed protein product [Rotaria sordida]CAF1227212.1 unnamed protein product [Rotaria sordida]
MQAFLNFRQHIHRLLNSNSSVGDTTFIVKHLEDEASNLCLSFDTQIQSLRDDLLAKDNELIKTMQERFNPLQELNTTKDSAHTIIKCLNISLKASSHTIARTIIEMIAREHLHSMNLAIEKLMDKLRREKNYAKAFITLYKTLSEAVHNCGLCYEEDVLPIPDIIENIFSKSDALALATFYSITLPNMPYEIVSNVAKLPSNSSYWLNSGDLKNCSNTSTTTIAAADEKSSKRKLDENEENEGD